MAGVIDQKGQRAASIRYLEEELKKDLSPLSVISPKNDYDF